MPECIADIQIGSVTVGYEKPSFIIAELSANHNQDIQVALDTISAARDSGASAIKLQTYTPDTITLDCDDPLFRIEKGTLWDGKTLYQLYAEAFTPWEWHEKLFAHARHCGLVVFSSPFDPTAVDFLDQLSAPAFKIASFEITDIPLIQYAAARQKPMIISTGIASLAEIREAVDACFSQGNRQVILLKCTSAYPAPFSEVNLRTIPDMQSRFDVHIGLSDHTEGIAVPIASVGLGATVIEKHIILDRSMGGPDAAFSLEPREFASMVKGVREAEAALGVVDYNLSEKVKRSREFSRSLFIVKDVAQGEELTQDNVRSIRPAAGLAPKFLSTVIGKRVKQKVRRGTPLSWDILE